jgi:hypothetical protein
MYSKYSGQFTMSVKFCQIPKSGTHMCRSYSMPSWSPPASSNTILMNIRLRWLPISHSVTFYTTVMLQDIYPNRQSCLGHLTLNSPHVRLLSRRHLSTL